MGKAPSQEAQERYVPIRLSHLLRHCSVGAIVRDSDRLMVVPDIRDWDKPGGDPLERQLRYVDRVRSALGIGHASLCTPPVALRLDNGRMHGWIPVPPLPALDALSSMRLAGPSALAPPGRRWPLPRS